MMPLVLRFSPYLVILPFESDVKDAAHGEVHSALAVGSHIVENAADAIHRIACCILLARVLRCGASSSIDGFSPRFSTNRAPLRVHRDRTAGIRAHVGDGVFAVLIELHDSRCYRSARSECRHPWWR